MTQEIEAGQTWLRKEDGRRATVIYADNDSVCVAVQGAKFDVGHCIETREFLKTFERQEGAA